MAKVRLHNLRLGERGGVKYVDWGVFAACSWLFRGEIFAFLRFFFLGVHPGEVCVLGVHPGEVCVLLVPAPGECGLPQVCA